MWRVKQLDVLTPQLHDSNYLTGSYHQREGIAR